MANNSNKQKREHDINGLFIYHDDKDRTFYQNFLMKQARYVNKSEKKNFSVFNLRLPICAFLCVVILVYDGSYILSLIIPGILYIISTAIFMLWYIPKLPIAPNFDKKKDDVDAKNKFENVPAYQLGIEILTGIVCVVVIFVYVSGNKITGFSLILYYVLAIAALIFSGYDVSLLIKKIAANHKDKKQEQK